MTSCNPPVVSMTSTVIDSVILVAPPRVAAAPMMAYVGSEMGNVEPVMHEEIKSCMACHNTDSKTYVVSLEQTERVLVLQFSVDTCFDN